MTHFLALIFALFSTAAFAQQPSPETQLSADWQALNTALLHVQQDLIAKMHTDESLRKQLAELIKENAALKAATDKANPSGTAK